MKLEIGTTVSYVNDLGDKHTGEIIEVISDSYDDVILTDGLVKYWSKKTIKTPLGDEYALQSELF